MFLHELIDTKKLGSYISDGLVTARVHPTLPLTILNYSPAAASVKEWDRTLSYCRGLVYDNSNTTVVAIPFLKFWNFNDSRHEETLEENFPKCSPHVYEKMDGSLLVGFFYRGEFVVATRGSFESEQAKWATKWIEKNVTSFKGKEFDRFTYLFEVIIPEDRKVVNYPFSGLVFLGAVETSSGNEYPPEDVRQEWLENSGIKMVEKYYPKNLSELQAENTENREGYVVVWYPLYGPALRVKIKFETYCKLHRMYFQTTPDVIWEYVKEGKKVRDVLSGADEELILWAENIEKTILEQHEQIENESSIDYWRVHRETLIQNELILADGEKEIRKQFAIRAIKAKYPDLLFSLLDGKLDQYKESIWKKVRPKNNKPLKEDNA